MTRRALRTCRNWYERNYQKDGFAAQRLYPNEELCRFLGREFFGRTRRQDRRGIRVLEIGCGSCSNLWMISKEGFDAYGIDLSARSIALGRRMLARWSAKAKLFTGSMTDIPFDDDYFNVVVDVFSSNCLGLSDFRQCLREVRRVMKPGGLFFTYTPSAASDAFRNHKPARKLDACTLDGIRRDTSPYHGNVYPFRFMDPRALGDMVAEAGLKVSYLETVGRTYRARKEYFEFVTLVGVKA